ncbi:major facilitator superfamily domain-containing protein [Boletus reticuloceps]|uniref:Major facilitator superfamily domain-containing protein n=1 Tax=Boletus reticuloceps TaxID=495285 RepID=A0A8I3A5T6_9AGAM|nr:major facilitator superfamily domain-containing protein [Boletus reticuloceps]
MSSQRVDEETPLLQQAQQQKKGRTPLPWRQFTIILFLQLAEPLTSQVIAPFAPQLIRDIGITNGDETQVGYYVGLMHSLFFATQALTVLHWSRLSDHIGRKPVILTGLFGLSASMYCFGLSRTFWGLVLSRSLNGALNGNIGVMKSMMAEITDATNLPQAYAYMPIAWSSGATLGPYIGGSLSNPVDRFPDVFGHWDFFKTHPYFLACAVPATFTAVAWLVTVLFLKETLPHRVPLGRLITARFCKKAAVKSIPPKFSTTRETLENENLNESSKEDGAPLPLRALLVPRVLIAAGNYAALSLVDIAFRAIQPLFFATPTELGGLGLDPPRIGNILSVYGVVNGLFQVFFFADMNERFGTKAIYSVAMASSIPLMLTFPLINALARTQGLNWTVWLLVGVQLVLSIVLNLGYACIFIYIVAATPNRASLGATNGIAQLLVSVMRTIGPASSSSIFSISIKTPEHACASLLLPRKVWNRSID